MAAAAPPAAKNRPRERQVRLLLEKLGAHRGAADLTEKDQEAQMEQVMTLFRSASTPVDPPRAPAYAHTTLYEWLFVTTNGPDGAKSARASVVSAFTATIMSSGRSDDPAPWIRALNAFARAPRARLRLRTRTAPPCFPTRRCF